jgi:hypothetical protein
LTKEQNKNIVDVIAQEGLMTELFQDVISLVSVSTFIMTMAVWIGAF